jgi:hypothetical protein
VGGILQAGVFAWIAEGVDYDGKVVNRGEYLQV